MSDKTVLTITDMRNARYQGAIKNNKPNGIGFLFNIEHLFVLSQWRQDEPNGNTFIVYPNKNYFYGFIV